MLIISNFELIFNYKLHVPEGYYGSDISFAGMTGMKLRIRYFICRCSILPTLKFLTSLCFCFIDNYLLSVTFNASPQMEVSFRFRNNERHSQAKLKKSKRSCQCRKLCHLILIELNLSLRRTQV